MSELMCVSPPYDVRSGMCSRVSLCYLFSSLPRMPMSFSRMCNNQCLPSLPLFLCSLILPDVYWRKATSAGSGASNFPLSSSASVPEASESVTTQFNSGQAVPPLEKIPLMSDIFQSRNTTTHLVRAIRGVIRKNMHTETGGTITLFLV